MKGHYIVHENEKVWIPGCYACIYTEPFCSCRENEKERAKFYKENDPEYKARQENKQLWKENAELQRVINRLIEELKKLRK